MKQVQNKKSLKVVADTWCPINCESKDNPKGLFIEVAKELALRSERKLDYSTDSWARSKKLIEAGEADLILGTTKEETPSYVFTSEPWGEIKFCYYTDKKSTWSYRGKNDLKNLKVGIINEYYYGSLSEDLKEAEKLKNQGLVLDAINGDGALDRNVSKLLKGRIDVFAEAAPVIFLMKTQQDEYKKLREAGCSTPLPHYGAFSPKNADSHSLANLANQIILDWKASGKWEKLKSEYGF